MPRAMIKAAAPRRKPAKAPKGPKPPKAPYSYDRPGPWGNFGRAAGGAVGSILGGGPGKMLGSKLGSYLHYIGKIFGSGDYVTSADQVRNNILVSEAQAPAFGHGRNTVHIRHREFLGDIVTSGSANTFNLQSYPIQPGLSSSFPWLSNVCGTSFQQYRINGMVFEFRSMSADALNSTNTALGSVVMATDYDSKDANFQSKAQMENTEFGVSCKPSSCMIHAIECAKSQTSVSELYIRNTGVPSGADIRLYDMGNFQIATTGFQGTSVNVGELWVSYDITLFKAIQLQPGAGILQYHRNLAATTAAQPLLQDVSVYATQPQYDNIGCSVNTANTILTLPVGLPLRTRFVMVYAMRGASTAGVVAPTATASQGLASHSGFINAGSAGFNAPQTATGTTLILVQMYEITAVSAASAPPIITFSGAGVFPGTTQGGDLYLIQMSASDGLV
nr:putative capsid protein [Crucivirus sp.]